MKWFCRSTGLVNCQNGETVSRRRPDLSAPCDWRGGLCARIGQAVIYLGPVGAMGPLAEAVYRAADRDSPDPWGKHDAR